MLEKVTKPTLIIIVSLAWICLFFASSHFAGDDFSMGRIEAAEVLIGIVLAILAMVHLSHHAMTQTNATDSLSRRLEGLRTVSSDLDEGVEEFKKIVPMLLTGLEETRSHAVQTHVDVSNLLASFTKRSGDRDKGNDPNSPNQYLDRITIGAGVGLHVMLAAQGEPNFMEAVHTLLSELPKDSIDIDYWEVYLEGSVTALLAVFVNLGLVTLGDSWTTYTVADNLVKAIEEEVPLPATDDETEEFPEQTEIVKKAIAITRAKARS